MPSFFGNKIKFQLFGESHGEAIGVIIDGLPSGEYIDTEELNRFMQKRAPGAALTTKRAEKDKPEFISGVTKLSKGGFYTADSPLCAITENHDAKSDSYESIASTPRPSHADYTAAVHSHGFAIKEGGGHHSGRLTAPLCIAGGICIQLLRRRGIEIGAEIASIGDIFDLFDENIILCNKNAERLGFSGFRHRNR